MNRARVLNEALEALALRLSGAMTHVERRIIHMASKGPSLVLVEGDGEIAVARRNLRRVGILHFGHTDEKGRSLVMLEPLGERVHSLIHSPEVTS